MTVLITELVRADIAGSISSGMMLIFIGLGLIGLGMWGRKKIRQGTAIDVSDKGR